MKIVLETKSGTDFRKNELKKVRYYLEKYYQNNIDPFDCKNQCSNSTQFCHIECIKEYIEKCVEKIDNEGVLYL